MTNGRRSKTGPPPGNRTTSTPIPDGMSQGITFRINRALLAQLLRLAPDVTITDAAFDPDTTLAEFTLDVPAAPPDAEELQVTYRHTGGRDPIHATSTWAPANADAKEAS